VGQSYEHTEPSPVSRVSKVYLGNMKSIICCLVNKKYLYRGIDREADLGVFARKISKQLFNECCNLYLDYLSCEGDYNDASFKKTKKYADFVSIHCMPCEIVLYDLEPITDEKEFAFLGIDIVDSHRQSVLKGRKPISRDVNQYGLFSYPEAADEVIDRLEKRSKRYWGLEKAYVYLYKDTLILA